MSIDLFIKYSLWVEFDGAIREVKGRIHHDENGEVVFTSDDKWIENHAREIWMDSLDGATIQHMKMLGWL